MSSIVEHQHSSRAGAERAFTVQPGDERVDRDPLQVLLSGLHHALSAPFPRLADQFSQLIRPHIAHSAVMILSDGLIGEQFSFSGKRSIVDEISRDEPHTIRAELAPHTARHTRVTVAGKDCPVFAVRSQEGPLLVLTHPAPSSPPERSASRRARHTPTAAEDLVTQLWGVIALFIQHHAVDASPHSLLESRAVSSARAEAVDELNDQHTMHLETLLLTLRSATLPDKSARQTATSIAASALIRMRTASERVRRSAEESVTTAFVQLREDLSSLVKHSAIDVQFVEPPADGRGLPREVAYGARAIVQGTILALIEQPDVQRVRVQWDCDGKNLLIDIRDNGPGELSVESERMQPLQQRIHALNGTITLSGTSGWGSEMTVVLPLDPPSAPWGETMTESLAPREREVLAHLAAGHRNKTIALQLGISLNTVKFHVSNVLRKLGVTSRGEAAARALESRLLPHL